MSDIKLNDELFDLFRYYLASKDVNIEIYREEFIERINRDIVNKFLNIASRIGNIIHTHIARNICEIFPLYGSSSIMVIMMPGCRVTEGNKGHNNFYSYDDILNQKYASWFPNYCLIQCSRYSYKKYPSYSDWK